MHSYSLICWPGGPETIEMEFEQPKNTHAKRRHRFKTTEMVIMRTKTHAGLSADAIGWLRTTDMEFELPKQM